MTDPKKLVIIALDQIKKYDLDLEKGDQIWCVFDVDRHNDQEIQKARKNAGDKVKICLSNPSFELWYLIHFYCYNCKMSNKDLIDNLRKYLPKYKKTENCFDQLREKRQNAIDNAKRLNEVHEKK